MKGLLVVVLCAVLGLGCTVLLPLSAASSNAKQRKAQVAACKRQNPKAPCNVGSSSAGTVVLVLVGALLDVVLLRGGWTLYQGDID